MTKKDKHPLAVYAQSVGLLLSDKAHRIHHQVSGYRAAHTCVRLRLHRERAS